MAGLALGSISTVLFIVLWVILYAPSPGIQPMRVADAVAVLNGSQVRGLDRRVLEGPPRGRVSKLVARAAARSLGVSELDVKAVWLRSPISNETSGYSQAVTLVAGREAIVEANDDGFNLWSGSAARLDADVPVPAFILALALPDGRWQTVSPKEPLLSPWRVRLIVVILSAGMLLALLAWLGARRLTRPVRELAEAARRLKLGPEYPPITITGPSEIRIAAEALNSLRDRLLSEVEQRTHMLAAVAHDLRNPLTGLRMRAELAALPHRARMVADIDRMSGMISQVLEYARGRELKESFQLVDLADLVERWVGETRASNEQVTCGELRSGLAVWARPQTLRRAYENLADNALRYAGEAQISARHCPGGVVLAIKDRGPGIEPEQVERLLRPFERLDRSRSSATGGVGLGLTIVRDIAQDHGGVLRLSPRRGGGLTASILLPLAGSAAGRDLYSVQR